MTDRTNDIIFTVQLSPIVQETNRRIAKNALDNLSDGQLHLVLEDYLSRRYGPRRGSVMLQMIARQLEISPWQEERR